MNSTTTQLIDLSFLRQFTRGDHEKISKYINMFTTMAPGMVLKMKDQLKSERWNDLRITAHSLKPQLAYLGINSLSSTIVEVENLSHLQQNTEELALLIDKIDEVIKEAVIELQSFK